MNRNKWSEGLDQWINDGWMGSKKEWVKEEITVFLSRFGTFLESSLSFAKQYVHFSKQLVQTATHHGLHAKASLLLKILSSSLKNKYLCQWPCQCHQNDKSLCHCVWIRQSNGCWPRPIPCPSIVRYYNIVLCSGYIYILASWWFTRCTFVRESQDSPVSNLPIQDRFRKKVLWKCIEICLTYYDNLFNHFACKDLCYELMPKCCGRWDYSTETHYNAFWSTWHKQLIM